MTKKSPKSNTRPKEQKPQGEAKPGGCLDFAAKLLAKSSQSMRCKDLIEAMLTNGLWKTSGKTPAATLSSAITREIATKKSASRFKKTGRGLFTVAKQ